MERKSSLVANCVVERGTHGPWAGLGEAMDEGLPAGTDLYFNKSERIFDIS